MMKPIGIVRCIDELGRVVIPKELRRTLGINEKDPLEIFADNQGHIVLRKYQPGCIFCGRVEGVRTFIGQNVCPECALALARRVG